MAGTVAAAAVWAAEPLPVAAGQPAKVTSVVRADARTGKLVRSVVVAPAQIRERLAPPVASPAAKTGAAAYSETVRDAAQQHNLPPQLLDSVIKVESNYNPRALSPKGAQGLMQLIPATAQRFGVTDAFDPVENVQAGARYLRQLLDLYNGDYPLALAAYNAGEQAVAHYGTVPPYRETQNYLRLVARELAADTQAAKPAATPAKAAEAAPEGPSHVARVVEPDGTVHYVSQ